MKTQNLNSVRHMFLAFYYKNKSEVMQSILQSSVNVLKTEVDSVKNMISNQYDTIKQLFQQEQIQKRMTTIREEIQEQQESILDNMNKIVGQIKGLSNPIKRIIEFYKTELTNIANQTIQLKKKMKHIKKQEESRKSSLSKIEQQQQQNEPRRMNKQPIVMQQKREWSELNVKIENFRKKFKLYDQEIKQKDQIIMNLKKELQKERQLNGENKILKKNLTTLRGEKSMMNSQHNALKKLLVNKQTIIQVQECQLGKFKIQIEQLKQKLDDAQKQLNQLKNGYKQNLNSSANNNKKFQKLSKDYQTYMQNFPKNEFQQLKNANALLNQNLRHTENNLLSISEKLGHIQHKYQQVCAKDKIRIEELEKLMNEKNQTIIRLKAQKTQQKYQYYVQLVKMLTKKVLDKDEYIQQLKRQLNRGY